MIARAYRFVFLVGIFVLPTEALTAQEPDESTNQSRFVLRISRQFVRDRVMPTIEDVKPVNRILFGAHVTGTATTTGKTSVVMDLQEDEAVFTLKLKGHTINKTVAVRRPVQVYSTGTTTFEAKRTIRFDGLRFVAEPATIDASHSCTTDGIAPVDCSLRSPARKRHGEFRKHNQPATPSRLTTPNAISWPVLTRNPSAW